MITNDKTQDIAILSNVVKTSEFKMKATAKSFQILSSGLYSNKIRAIIRELSCNAVDSHVAAGKIDIPFEVHLPTILEPWFSVRDFGTGLDGDQVTNIFTVFFESTKTDSNAFIGALGLGSKSPFSYTENFTVTAIKNGVCRIYSAFINDVGVPSIAEMSEALTDEGNGVEVKFSVTDRYDFQSFRNEAVAVFKWFEHKPTVTGVSEFLHCIPEYTEKNVVPGVHVGTDQHTSSIAIMGNIAYPLNNIPEAEKHFGELASLLSCGLTLEFEIGDLDFAASREQLSYIPLTLNSIRKKLEALNANLTAHFAKKADAIVGEWERAQLLYSESRSQLYKSAVIKYATDTKFPLYNPDSYYGKKEFVYNITDLAARGLEIKAFRVRGGQSNRICEGSTYVGNTYTKTMTIPVDMDVVIVLNDLKTGCAARARYHFLNHHGKPATVFCVSSSHTDPVLRQAEYDKLIVELHNPPLVVKASTLEKQKPKKAISTQGIAYIGLKSARRAGHEDAYTWVPFTEAIDENVTYYYITLSNHTPIDSSGEEFPMFAIKAMMDECGITEISSIRVLGVRKNRIKELQDLDNWVWFEDKLRDETAKITDEHVASLVATEMLDSYYNRVYTNKNVAKSVGPDSDYAKYVNTYANLKRATGNVTHLVSLCEKYGKSVHVETVKNEIENAKQALCKKYPLLQHISTNAPESMFADYIKMVDKNG